MKPVAVSGVEDGLEKGNGLPLAMQIYTRIRGEIVSGRLPGGASLPSTRELAQDLGVSRGRILEAYEILGAEGFIESRQGAPSRVRKGLAFSEDTPAGVAAKEIPKPCADERQRIRYDFRTGVPALGAFPLSAWLSSLTQCRGIDSRELGYTGPEGCSPLRAEIAGWLYRTKGMPIAADDVFVTAGSTHCFNVLADILRGGGNGGKGVFALETPCHPGMRGILARRGIPVAEMEVDELGARPQTVAGWDVAAYYVTPSHQFPLGWVMAAERRIELARCARERNAYIVEDDYDGEFRYRGHPIPPLHSYDGERVIYAGTFSKTLYPACRLGFAVLPRSLREAWRTARHLADMQNPILEQLAMADFMRSGRLSRHISKMRRLYARRRKTLVAAAALYFGERGTILGDASGLHVALSVRGGFFGEAFYREALERGVRAYPLEMYTPSGGRHTDKILLGYGNIDEAGIVHGLKILAGLT